jgi:hypothetical protein
VLAESFSQLATMNHIACQSFAKASTSMLSPRHLLFLHSSLRIHLRMLKRESQGSRLWAAEATNHYLQRTKVGPVRDRLSEGGSHCGFLASTSTVTSKSKDRISMRRKIRKSEFSYESSQRAIPANRSHLWKVCLPMQCWSLSIQAQFIHPVLDTYRVIELQ